MAVPVPSWPIVVSNKKSDVMLKNAPTDSAGSDRVSTTVSKNDVTAVIPPPIRLAALPRATPAIGPRP